VTLTLAIRNSAGLGHGMPAELVLHRRDAVVGRSANCDWSLPDPRNHISSRHVEIRFDGRCYVLSDVSTNGTYLNGASERMSAPRRIEDGDVVQIGHYEIVAHLSGEASDAGRDGAAAPTPEWRGWDPGAPAANAAPASGGWDAPPPSAAGGAGGWAPPSASPAPASSGGWDSTPPPPSSGGRWQPQLGPSLARPEPHRAFGAPTPTPAPAPVAGGWAPSHRAPDLPVASAWASATPAPDPASAWSSSAPDRPAAPAPDDIWGRIADGNVVDWARGGFGQPIERPRDPLGLDPAPARDALPPVQPQMARGIEQGWGTPPASAPAPAPPAAAPAPTPVPAGPPPGEAFVTAAGLPPARVADLSPAMIERAGALFRRLVAGLVVMVEARARAKAQLGAEATQYNPQGTNPIKFARSPDDVLALLLAPPQPGFMAAETAVEDAFHDLQSHQMATLRAMQGALQATLDRFSPTAIRARAESKGVLERVIPTARDAALWQAYEREFGGVAQGSDEAFMDVFAKEFRRAYNEQARR
jgi:type VI secretion system FHA domain protein